MVPQARDGIGFGEFVALGQELGAAGKFAEGVLETGQAIGLHLGPIEGDVGEIFDIHLEAGEGRIGRFDRAEIVFALVAALGLAGELVLAQEAVQGVVADFEIKLGNEAAGAEAGCFFPLSNALGLPSGGGFMRAGMGSAGDGKKAFIVTGLKAANPFADGVARTLVTASRRLDALFESVGDQFVAERKFRIGGADHVVVR